MSGNTPYLSSHSWYFIWLLEQFTNSSKLKYIWMEKTLASVSENVWLLNSDTKMIKQGGEGQYGMKAWRFVRFSPFFVVRHWWDGWVFPWSTTRLRIKHNTRDFNSIFSRRVTGFHRWVKLLELNFFTRNTFRKYFFSEIRYCPHGQWICLAPGP